MSKYNFQIFNFTEFIINWVWILQKGFYTQVSRNRDLSEKITHHRGCRQGEHVSPYIFVLCAKLFAEEICNDENIRGIEIFGSEHDIGGICRRHHFVSVI